MKQIERDKYWQDRWDQEDVFTWRDDRRRPSFYVLEMFPYTSGRMHMGHARNYSMGDALARMQRARGFDVLYPMGWDAFGLPAETAAIKHGRDPAEFTAASISGMKSAMRSLGLSYSWANEINTSSPDYIAAQQRLFIELFKAGLVFRDTSFVYWCHCSNTVLAAEQAAGGVCWRCGQSVTKRRESQWFFDIRSYADRLVDDLDKLEGWPASVINIQRTWIGRNSGIEVEFRVEDSDATVTVFTTRADTLAGCTFLALAPEHRLLDILPMEDRRRSEVLAYRDAILIQSAEERANAPKSGLDLGVTAINPLTGETVPIFVANYVLSDYGSGAVMAVPAHDERDFEFARAEGLPIRRVVAPGPDEADAPLDAAYLGDGVVVNSGPLDGLSPAEARDRLLELPGMSGCVRAATSYRLQNWSISRQRFWGNPIPIVHCGQCGAQPADEKDLPILLPTSVPPEGEGSPLSRVPAFHETTCPSCGGPARRDTDTMDTFVDSSWYFMRFPTPDADAPIDRETVNRLLPVDVYIGGVEHATLHLIYARFMTKVLKDLGFADMEEPFVSLYNQGMVNDAQGRKQSKSLGNIVEPQDVIRDHGADALRLYLLFKTTYNAPINWDDAGLRSAGRYIDRVHRLTERFSAALAAAPGVGVPARADCRSDMQTELCRRTHEAIDKVTRDTSAFQFNTAIAALMELTNELYQYEETDADPVAAGAVRTLIRLLNPFAPHTTEDMWRDAGGAGLLAAADWPVFDPEALVRETVTLAIQVNGRFVSETSYPKSMTRDDLIAAARAREDVQRRLGGKPIVKDIYVPGRILNLVAAR